MNDLLPFPLNQWFSSQIVGFGRSSSIPGLAVGKARTLHAGSGLVAEDNVSSCCRMQIAQGNLSYRQKRQFIITEASSPDFCSTQSSPAGWFSIICRTGVSILYPSTCEAGCRVKGRREHPSSAETRTILGGSQLLCRTNLAKCFFALLVAIGRTFTVNCATAQSNVSGSISGTVTYVFGAAILGASVTITNVDRGEDIRVTKTNGVGILPRQKPLPLGTYKVTITRCSYFKTEVVTGHCSTPRTHSPSIAFWCLAAPTKSSLSPPPKSHVDREDATLRWTD